jgi:hypothetical protein
MKVLLVLLIASGSLTVYSQVDQMQVQANDLMSSSNMVRSFDNRYKEIKGYPTLLKAYCPGEVLLTSGVRVKQDSINLDVYHSDLLVKKGKDTMIIIKGMVVAFTMKSPTSEMNFEKIRDPLGNDLFFEVLVKGKLNLYKRTTKTISEPTGVDDGYSTSRKHSIFVQSIKIFIQKENAEMIELKNKKVLLSQYPDREESITKFMKENGLGVKDEAELAKVVEYINTL